MAPSVESVVGEALIARNYPLIHAVGRASPRAPRLIDLVWGFGAHHPESDFGRQGCVFPSCSRLDLKNSSGMLTMKKDMGGAACVLGLAHMIMAARLPIRLRVLIPAAENSISGATLPIPATCCRAAKA